MDASDIPVEAKEGLWVGCVVKKVDELMASWL
jgi:hypothetical protein